MALTADTLKANEILSSLTAEQLTAITNLSKNDEDNVIGSKVGEIHRQYDETILKATGIDRDGDEKSYKYLERAGAKLKGQAASVSTLEEQVTNLKDMLKKGGSDKELKAQLESTIAELDLTKTQFNEVQLALKTNNQDHASKLFGMQVDYEIGQATSGIKFKPELPESASKVLMQQAIAKVKGNKAEFIDDGAGGQRLVFKNEAGATLNNPKNQLNPYTAAELLGNALNEMGVIDEGRKVPGGGTKPPGGKGGGTTVDVASARTQVEANAFIAKQLQGQGLARGTAEYDTANTKAWSENKISALPEK